MNAQLPAPRQLDQRPCIVEDSIPAIPYGNGPLRAQALTG